MLKIKRDHTGNVHLFVNEAPANGAVFNGMAVMPEGMMAVFLVPLAKAAFGEVDNVVPFVTAPIRS